MKETLPETLTFYIAGVKFRPDYRIVMKELAESETHFSEFPLSLVGEPSNEHDPHAVKILAGGRHIGYVPKALAADVWRLRDEGWKPHAKIVGFAPDAETYEMFRVEVTFTRPPT